MIHRFIYFLFLSFSVFLAACDKSNEEDDNNNDQNQSNNCDLAAISEASTVKGYGILEKLPGIWNGPVYSPTPLGSYPEWIVDFRPISAAQVSAKNELDPNNDIFMSFFIAKYKCEYQVAFRNGGSFGGQSRNSYMIVDSVFESSTKAFYRFTDPVSGGNRVYTDITFKTDSLIMVTYTNQYNTLEEPQIHMRWRAGLQDESSTQAAIDAFGFPQKVLIKDFSTTFDSISEAVFYAISEDPYPEAQHPYLGQTDVEVNISQPANVDTGKLILIIITSAPLFDGLAFLPENLKYRSRYVFVEARKNKSYLFNYMHPGDYYLNAIYDENGDQNFSSGDYMNSNFDQEFTLEPELKKDVSIQINFQIP